MFFSADLKKKRGVARLSAPYSILAIVLASPANAQSDAPEAQAIELFEGPVREEMVMPQFPSTAATQGREGWVELGYMVDVEGKAYEIMMVDHAGHEAFIEAAVRALERSTFRPARTGDKVVASSGGVIFRFAIEGNDDFVGRDFAARYRQFISALQEAAQTEIENALSELDKVDISYNNEYAHLSLARYLYAERYGTTMEQMEHLKNALGESLESPHWRSYLDAEATTARRALLLLQVRNKYFAEALSTLELMRLKGDDEGVELFRQLSELVSAEKASAEPYGAAGRVGENGSWSIALFRRSFYFDDLLGSVEELKLRCQPGLVFFAFDPETRYEVSDSARECRLEVIGAPGTTFTLVQQ